MQKSKKINFIWILILAISACTEQGENQDSSAQKVIVSAELISLNNQGVGEMGSFDYTKATSTFETLVKRIDDWDLAKQNLAIALLNRQKPGDEDNALQIVNDLSVADKSNLVADYIVGILKFNQGLCDEALPRFEKVIKGDYKDAYALYFAGQCYLQNGEVQTAFDLYQKAIKADNYLRSAYYGGFMAAQRLEKPGLAKEMLGAYQKLASNPKARLAEIKYTRMGPKATAIAYSDENVEKSYTANVSAPYFSAPKILALQNIEKFGLVNLSQTQKPQLYTVSGNTLHLYDNYLNKPIERDGLAIDLSEGNHQIAWGDINNDNKIDVYITGEKDQLYLQKENGFKAVDMGAFGLGGLSSKAIRLSDADHDGDLDVLLLSQQGKFELWNNNLNNTFSALSEKTYLPPETGYKSIFIQDIDSDRDVDIILQGDEKFITLLNNRMWDYEVIYSLKIAPKIESITFADNNTDGKPEISLLAGNGLITTYDFDTQLNYYSEIKRLNDFKSNTLLQIDVNGSGQKEFLLADNEGIKIVAVNGKVQEQIMLSGVTDIKVLNTLNGPELLVLQNKQIIHIPASKNRLPYLLFNLSGKEDDANSVRSNYSGIGTEVTLRNQSFYAIGNSFHNLTGIDQDYQAINLAAGVNKTIDYIDLEWSDGVYQTELGLETSKYYKITETQRQLSSCPVIFAWNNGKYEFVSDVLGVGGIGFALGRHEYGSPRPWENYLLTNDQLSSHEGVFKLQFSEPMEESAYLDEFQIEVVDVPDTFNILLDERMGISLPKVTGEIVSYQNKINPIRVINQNNTDVTGAALITDKVAIEIENNDSRFLGLVDEQVIKMEFDQDLLGNYQFIMNGWVEYGYSQTMFAAWQAGKIAHAPTLEYFANGQWNVLLKEFGYPAGMPRSASVAVQIPQETRKLRIRTNMEVYFDELSLVVPTPIDSIIKHQMTLQSAQLKVYGFPQRTNNRQRVPSYDVNRIHPFWDTRYMEGAYTQLGEIKPLLEKSDNALAIIAAGESIEFTFIDDLPKLKNGYTRFYLLKFIGWAKDMDILTLNGETLAPIPKNGKISTQAQFLNQKYNNRFKAGK
jgi:tetratricopeptide (TPR) repeat protein